MRLWTNVYHGALPLVRTVVGWEAWPEALEGKGPAPRVDVPILGRRVGGSEYGCGKTRVNGLFAETKDGCLVVVTHSFTNPWEVFDNLDAEFLELSLWTHPTELQDLRRIKGSARDNNLFFGEDLGQWALGTGDVLRIGLVDRRALHHFNAKGARLVSRVSEQHLCDKCPEF